MRYILGIVLILFLLQTSTAQHRDSIAFYKLKDSLEFYRDMLIQLKSDQLEWDTISGLENNLLKAKKQSEKIEDDILITLKNQDKRILPFIHTALAAELQLPKDLNPKTPILDVRRASFLSSMINDEEKNYKAIAGFKFLVLNDSIEYILYNRMAECEVINHIKESILYNSDRGYYSDQYIEIDTKLENFKTAMSKLCEEFRKGKISQVSFKKYGYKGLMTFDKVQTYGINPFIDGDQCQCK